MRGSFAGRAALGAAVLVAAQAAQAGTITGTVIYDGKVPALKPLAVAAEPMCAKKHDDRCRTRRWCWAPATRWPTCWSAS